MLEMLIKNGIAGHLEKNKLYAEDIIWQREVYPIYIIVKNNFRYCMQNKLLTRQQILNFKYQLNKYVKKKKYTGVKFKNDCHEVYSKLKDTSISKKQMFKLNAYLLPVIELADHAEACRDIAHLETCK